MIGVYKITNPVGAIYIGSSKNLARRFKQYKYLRYNEQCKLKNSIDKYGYYNHKFEILELCDLDDLLERERYYCLLFNVLNRDNLNLKIPKLGSKSICMSQESRDKISKAHKGKKLSKEQVKALRASTKGKKQSKEHIEKRKMFGDKNPAFGNQYFKGKKHTDETKKILSNKRKGMFCMGDNPNSKKVIDMGTNEIYDCAKQVSNKFNINYSTLKSYLNGNLKNKTNFKYLKENEKTNKNSKRT